MMAKMPPITPPTIAPVFDLWFAESELLSDWPGVVEFDEPAGTAIVWLARLF